MQDDKPEPIGPSPGPSDADKRVQEAPKGISAVAVLWTFGKCLGALLPVYLAGYYRVSTSLLVCGMMVYTGWKHAREAKEARLKSAIQFLDGEDECASGRVSGIKRELPAWVRLDPDLTAHPQDATRRQMCAHLPSCGVPPSPTMDPEGPWNDGRGRARASQSDHDE